VVRGADEKGIGVMPKLPNTLIVLPYDPNWKTEFERIRHYLLEHIGDLVLEIKHVGSTSVPGLCAKPIIDIVAVMESYEVFPEIISRLEKVGYQHEGDRGVKDREAFKRLIPDDFMDYHFYICPKDSEELSRWDIFLNALRNNNKLADEYGKLKMRLIDEVNGDRVLYTDSKTDFIVGVINKAIKNGDVMKNIQITDREITKEELNAIYDDFKVIDRENGIPDAPQVRYQYMAEQNGNVVGFASGLTNHKWFYLSDMWVESSYRRQGLGKKLLSMLEERVQSIGIEHIYTWTSGKNNERFYEQQGYRIFTIFENFFEKDGFDYVGYRKDFNPPSDNVSPDFWQALDKLVSESKIIIDRLKGSHHPKYPKLI
jgi:GrpB-like predicted nucleotidyltransferase (UPF0157 family)/GNAT superfamily N-acetyltransferase